MRNIVKSTVVAIVLAATASSVVAADSPELRAAAADRYLKVVPMSKMLDDTFAEMVKQVPPENGQQFLSQMKAAVRADVLESISRESMVKIFTADELNALAEFYGSKNGESAMKKFGVYMGAVMPAIQQEVMQAFKKIQAQKK